MMKLMGRTSEKSYLNNYKGESWQEVKECYGYYPSGCRKCVKFPDGFKVKVELCELVYVFDK